MTFGFSGASSAVDRFWLHVILQVTCHPMAIRPLRFRKTKLWCPPPTFIGHHQQVLFFKMGPFFSFFFFLQQKQLTPGNPLRSPRLPLNRRHMLVNRRLVNRRRWPANPRQVPTKTLVDHQISGWRITIALRRRLSARAGRDL